MRVLVVDSFIANNGRHIMGSGVPIPEDARNCRFADPRRT
jgi:hypothetical protein